MRQIIISIGMLLLCLTTYAQDQKIFGGDAIDITEAPYQVSLEINGSHACGGTIIDCEWIITAAHCVDDGTDPDDVIVHAGSTDQTDNGVGQRIEVEQIIIHNDYTPTTSAGGGLWILNTNDIALIKLKEPLTFNDAVTAIPYATSGNTSGDEIAPGQSAFISGWGTTEFSPSSSVDLLRGVDIPIIDNDLANDLLDDPDNDCAPNDDYVDNTRISFFEEGLGLGWGDSGGPAVLGSGAGATLIGVCSWSGCPRGEFPSIYTNVLAYTDFIESNITDCCEGDLVYHFEDQDGNETNEFCLGQDVYVDGSETIDVSNYFMDLWILEDSGELDWISGAGWISGDPDLVNITELFENDPEHPVEFQVGITYALKLAINHPNCGWVELIQTFTFTEPDSVSYHYEDKHGNDQTEFCLGEDVYVNGSATLDTDNFFMDLWIVDGAGEYDWISGAGWMSGSPDFVNITDLFANDPENPVTFQVGETYSVKLAINDPDCGWVSLQHDFTIVEPNSVAYHYEDANGNERKEFCPGEDVFLNGSATLDTDNFFMDLWIVDDAGDYDWISGAGWMPGSPDLVNITELFENDPENPVTFVIGETYSVKLAINDPDCGWVSLQHDFTIVECCNELSAPENLQLVEGNLSWDPVPGAIGYVVESTRFWPMDCRCDFPVSIVPIHTEETNVALPMIAPGRCFVIQVTAICADGSESSPSDYLCIGGKKGLIDGKVILDAFVSPNPSFGDMSFNVRTSIDTPVSIEVYDFNGTSIKLLQLEAVSDENSGLDWTNTRLSPGVYFVRFSTESETVVKQVIVN
ncbi:MAG: trypsin-like serine protease [Gilvibacter sp.]